MLSKKDKELIEIASEVLERNCNLYESRDLHVACALLAKSGKVYTGINIKTSHSVCAEQVAIGQALTQGEREFDTIVAVKFDDDGSIRVVSPCGLCRYIINNLNLTMNVILEDVYNNKVLKIKSKDLLPYPYKRHDLD